MLLAKTSMFLALGSFLIAGVPTAIAKDRKGQSSRLGYAYAPEGNQANSERSEAIRECSTNAGKISYRDFQTFQITAYRSCMFDHGQWFE